MGIVVTGEQLDLFSGEADPPQWAHRLAELVRAWAVRQDRGPKFQVNPPQGVPWQTAAEILSRLLGSEYVISNLLIVEKK